MSLQSDSILPPVQWQVASHSPILPAPESPVIAAGPVVVPTPAPLGSNQPQADTVAALAPAAPIKVALRAKTAVLPYQR